MADAPPTRWWCSVHLQVSAETSIEAPAAASRVVVATLHTLAAREGVRISNIRVYSTTIPYIRRDRSPRRPEDPTMHDRISSAATYGGSGTAVVGGVTFNEWMALGGLLVAIAGLAYNMWHSTRMRSIARANKCADCPAVKKDAPQ